MIKDIAIGEYLETRGLQQDLSVYQFPGLDEVCGLLRMRSGWVDTQNWLPITEDKYTFLNFSKIFSSPKYTHYFEPAFDSRLSSDMAGALDNVFLLGSHNNYFHMLMDFIPRLAFLRFLPDLRGATVVVDRDLTDPLSKVLSQAMGRVGLDEGTKLLPVPRGDVFRLKNALVPSAIRRRTAVRVWEEFLTPPVTRHGPERLFVMRKDVHRRNLLNQDEIAEQLRELEFVPVEPGRLTFVEQVRIFSNARVVVGVHGAGLANLLFSPRGGHLIDLQVPPLQPFFRDLAAAKSFRYTVLAGTRNSADPTHHSDFVIDADQLLATVRLILQGELKIRIRSTL